jgi:UDP-3-O-[3-hydroxymyristoyl] glucosamine N-acyltransferase
MQHTLSELAELCEASLEGDGGLVIRGPASLRAARADQVAFFEPRHPYVAELLETRAGALVARAGQELPRRDLAVLRCAEPMRAFGRIVALYAAKRPVLAPGIHPSAVVDPSARLAAGVAVGPLAVVGERADIGERAAIHAHAVVGAGARIGPDTILYPGAVIYDGVELGARCIVHSSAVIGADGYGFEPTPEGWVKIPQLGTVVVGDDVEIGAACTVDRGRFGPTLIGRGTKLDDQVHVAHNVEIGEHTMLAAQVGIAGSARIGSRVLMGGQVGIGGHTQVGDGARLAGKTGPFGDVPAGAELLGYPGLPRREALRQQVLLGRLPKLVERLAELEQRLARLEAEQIEARDEEVR